jgi:PAS domain S-box-containing protein
MAEAFSRGRGSARKWPSSPAGGTSEPKKQSSFASASSGSGRRSGSSGERQPRSPTLPAPRTRFGDDADSLPSSAGAGSDHDHGWDGGAAKGLTKDQAASPAGHSNSNSNNNSRRRSSSAHSAQAGAPRQLEPMSGPRANASEADATRRSVSLGRAEFAQEVADKGSDEERNHPVETYPQPVQRRKSFSEVASTASSGNSSRASTSLTQVTQLISNLENAMSIEDMAGMAEDYQDCDRTELTKKSMTSMMLCNKLMSLFQYPMVILTPDGTIQGVSPSVKGLLGYEPEEIVERNVNMLMPPEIGAKHDAILANYMGQQKRKQKRISSVVDTTRPVVAMGKNGEQLAIFLSVRAVRGEQNALPILFLGQMRDARREISLRSALVEADLLAQVFPFPYIEATEKGIITSFNPAAERSFGMSSGIAVGKNVVVLMPKILRLINGKREPRSSHMRIVDNYVQKIKDVGRESVTSNVVGKKTRHKAVRVKSDDPMTIEQESFDIELEVTMGITAQGTVSFRAFIRVLETYMNREEAQAKLIGTIFPKPVADRYTKGLPVNGSQDLSCIFVDIVGFTTLASITEDQQTVEILNDIWQRFSAIQKMVPGYEPIKTNYDELSKCGCSPRPMSLR